MDHKTIAEIRKVLAEQGRPDLAQAFTAEATKKDAQNFFQAMNRWAAAVNKSEGSVGTVEDILEKYIYTAEGEDKKALQAFLKTLRPAVVSTTKLWKAWLSLDKMKDKVEKVIQGL